jgi:hypothetical protein
LRPLTTLAARRWHLTIASLKHDIMGRERLTDFATDDAFTVENSDDSGRRAYRLDRDTLLYESTRFTRELHPEPTVKNVREPIKRLKTAKGFDLLTVLNNWLGPQKRQLFVSGPRERVFSAEVLSLCNYVFVAAQENEMRNL